MKNACDFSVFSKFDLGACIHSLAFGWIDAIPTDWLLWGAFLAGLVLGSIIGWKRLLAIGVAIALYKLIFDRPKRAPADDIWPHPDEQRRKRFELPDLFGRMRGGRGRSGSPDFRDWIEGED